MTEKLTPLIGARAAQYMKLLTIHWNNLKSVPAPKQNEAVVHQLLTEQQVVSEVFKSQLLSASVISFLSLKTSCLNWDKPRYSQPLIYVWATGIASWMRNPVYSPCSQYLLEGASGAGSHLDYLCPLKYSRKERIRL